MKQLINYMQRVICIAFSFFMITVAENDTAGFSMSELLGRNIPDAKKAQLILQFVDRNFIELFAVENIIINPISEDLARWNVNLTAAMHYVQHLKNNTPILNKYAQELAQIIPFLIGKIKTMHELYEKYKVQRNNEQPFKLAPDDQKNVDILRKDLVIIQITIDRILQELYDILRKKNTIPAKWIESFKNKKVKDLFPEVNEFIEKYDQAFEQDTKNPLETKLGLRIGFGNRKSVIQSYFKNPQYGTSTLLDVLDKIIYLEQNNYFILRDTKLIKNAQRIFKDIRAYSFAVTPLDIQISGNLQDASSAILLAYIRVADGLAKALELALKKDQKASIFS